MADTDDTAVDPSYASWPRRMVALVVDWVASTLVVLLFLGFDGYYSASGDPAPGLYTLGVFILESAVLTILLGGSFGKLVTGLRTAPIGRPTAAWPAIILLRQVMIALVIPPLVFQPDGRGLHDVIAATRTVRLPRR
ncbi:RDD family protein [Nocardioides lentus]|uniref:RDD family protein n=1 Tax=Nocardioides lentus TaxID=338077 RepID=A0ABP5B2X8_9ACTN